MAKTNNTGAVFTIVRDDPAWLRIWIKHYRQFFADKDIYVLDHESAPCAVLQELRGQVTVIPAKNPRSFDLQWLVDVVSQFQRYLLLSYDVVTYTDVDELLLTMPGGAYTDLGEYVRRLPRAYTVATGYEVVHKFETELPLDFSCYPLLQQRAWWYASRAYSKPLVARQPLTWCKGFHTSLQTTGYAPDPELLLVHLHKLDWQYKKQRIIDRANRPITDDPFDLRGSRPQRVMRDDELRAWWYSTIDGYPEFNEPQELVAIPDAVRSLI